MTPGGRRKPRGVAIVPVLVCFVLVMMITGVLLQLVRTERLQSQGEERRLQAEWLAEAGLERASARLARNRQYKGETWDIAAEDLGGRDAGLVTIVVETPKNEPTHRLVTVEADYPVEPERRARQRRSLAIELGPETTQDTAKPRTGDQP